MPRIIFKSVYLKKNFNKHSENLVKYIAKRDGVEKIDDTWKLLSSTRPQEILIKQLQKDFPDAVNSFEYQDYIKNPSKGTASEFITSTIDRNLDMIAKRENYIEYISKRPRVEKLSNHGLFTNCNVPIDLSEVAEEVANHDGNVWTNIISMRREDAKRLGYDNAYAWRNLLRGQAKVFAENMKIPIEDLKWYAAFHNESYHPHCHMVVYSTGKEPYLTEKGILNIRSSLARHIFKQDLYSIYEQQTKHRNDLISVSREKIAEITEQIKTDSYNNPIVETLLLELSNRLRNHKGKMVYGYLDRTSRNLVNRIVDELAEDKRIAVLYELWNTQRTEVCKTYVDEMPEIERLSQNKEFKNIKNAVIKEALTLSNYRSTFDRQNGKHENALKPVTKGIMGLLYSLSRMLEEQMRFDENEEISTITDHKLKSEINEKKLAHGIKLE